MLLSASGSAKDEYLGEAGREYCPSGPTSLRCMSALSVPNANLLWV
jgi:hypothetical protein